MQFQAQLVVGLGIELRRVDDDQITAISEPLTDLVDHHPLDNFTHGFSPHTLRRHRCYTAAI